ncbi:MarR family winged helix-turn-helix transcriptional regulator [Citricoccus parietis]|uniref:MarR family winged helix-turn-helix transcriptional regulator n=2 Tax=Citricoccus parietis TaxID=592307 RepID=A0ABV5G195_9MICC
MTAAHRFGAEAWGELTNAEYGVLCALTKDPRGVRITDLGQDVLLTQTGLTRLAAHLVNKGLVERVPDPDDGRAILLVLTDQGRYIQRRIAVIHTREITDTMTEHLCVEELLQLRDLCTKLIQQCPPTRP